MKSRPQVAVKSYSSILPFNLVLVYQKKGVFIDMITSLSEEFPELKVLEKDKTALNKQVLSFVFNDESNNNIFLFLTDNFGTDVLVHECVHVTFRLFEIVGSDINEETEEWFAYLNEFMFRESYKIITQEFKLKVTMNID